MYDVKCFYFTFSIRIYAMSLDIYHTHNLFKASFANRMTPVSHTDPARSFEYINGLHCQAGGENLPHDYTRASEETLKVMMTFLQG